MLKGNEAQIFGLSAIPFVFLGFYIIYIKTVQNKYDEFEKLAIKVAS